MHPRHHQLKFAARRALTAQARLQRGIWQIAESARIEIINTDGSRAPVELPHFWGKLYTPQNFAIAPPASAESGPLWLRWRDQAEGTLYVDGRPFFGFDPAHRECRLPEEFSQLEMRSHCVQSAIWHPDATGLDPQGSRLDGAEFLRRSDLHWKLYHDLAVLNELLKTAALRDNPENHLWFQEKGVMPDTHHTSPLVRRLLRDVDDACDLLDRGDLAALSAHLDQVLTALTSEPWNLDATVTGHSHIDLVWMWPESIGETKAVHTFSNVDYLMERYPEFRFGYSQPASYEAVQRRDLGLFNRVNDRIKEGRWEALGALYVESDTLTPCGEALARSFELGQAGFRKLNGEPSDILWLPDVFGYCGSLPQLMAHYGVKYFFTNKLTWNDTATFPHTSFRWIGNDGSEIVTHIHPETVQFYNGCATVGEIDRAHHKHLEADTHREMLIPTGFGDGGGGPTEEMCERIRRFRSFANLPRCEWSTIQGFYERLGAIRDQLPEQFGEMLIQFHRGTFSSQSSFKSRYRNLELALQRAEFSAVATGKGPVDAQWWKRLVFSQFHDILPGSSVHPAYVELNREFSEIIAAVEATTAENLAGDVPVHLLNPTPFEQSVWQGEHVLTLPAFGSQPVSEAAPAASPAVEVDPTRLTTRNYEATFNQQGEITSLRFGDQDVAIDGPLNQIVLHPNIPHSFNAWETDRQAMSLGIRQEQPAKVDITRHHNGLAKINFSRAIGENSRLTVTYQADALSSYLKIKYDFDWHETTTMAKAVMPTAYHGESTRFGSPLGSALRRQNPRFSVDEAFWEMPASRWALVSDDGETEGLTVVTENKYAFSNRHGALGVTLLTSPIVTGEGPGYAKAFPHSLREDIPDSDFADQGKHTFSLILAPWRAGQTAPDLHPAALADYAFLPPLTASRDDVSLPVHGLTGCTSAHIFWVQPVEDETFIVKTIESMGHRGEATLLLDDGWSATPVNGLQQVVGDPLEAGRITISPYRLQCFLIARKS